MMLTFTFRNTFLLPRKLLYFYFFYYEIRSFPSQKVGSRIYFPVHLISLFHFLQDLQSKRLVNCHREVTGTKRCQHITPVASPHPAARKINKQTNKKDLKMWLFLFLKHYMTLRHPAVLTFLPNMHWKHPWDHEIKGFLTMASLSVTTAELIGFNSSQRVCSHCLVRIL